MGRKKKESICDICKCRVSCADYKANLEFMKDGLNICIVECEKYKG